jgi:hypothetical protein
VRAGPLSRKLGIAKRTPADALEICYFQNSGLCSRRRTAAPAAGAVGYGAQSAAIFSGEDSGFFKINTGIRAPLSIEYLIELSEGCPKRPMLLRSICYAIAQHYRCACDINALRLKLNTFDDAKF